MLSVIAPCVMDGETPAPVSFPTSGMALVELPTVLLSGIASGTDDFSVCGTQAAERTAKRHILPHLYGRGHRSPLHLGAHALLSLAVTASRIHSLTGIGLPLLAPSRAASSRTFAIGSGGMLIG